MSQFTRRDFLRRAFEISLTLGVLSSGLSGYRALSAPYPNSELLVDVRWLTDHWNDTRNVRVIDARGPLKYRHEHIPNAVNLWDADVNTWSQGVPRLVAPPVQIQALLEPVGVSPDMTIVLYGDEQNRWAARLFWILEYYQFSRVKILDGGLGVWVAAGQTLPNEIPEFSPSQFELNADAKKIVSGDWLLERLQDPVVQIVDSRTAQEFAGGNAGHSRGGHIPGARLVPAERAVEADGRFKKANDLRLLYRGLTHTRRS